MSLLSGTDQSDLAAVALGFMEDTATISRPTRTRDASGGYFDAYAPAGSTPIMLYQASGTEDTTLAGQQSETAVQMMAKVPTTSGVLQRDRLTVRGQNFEVVTVQPVPTFAAAQRLALVVIP